MVVEIEINVSVAMLESLMGHTVLHWARPCQWLSSLSLCPDIRFPDWSARLSCRIAQAASGVFDRVSRFPSHI